MMDANFICQFQVIWEIIVGYFFVEGYQQICLYNPSWDWHWNFKSDQANNNHN